MNKGRTGIRGLFTQSDSERETKSDVICAVLLASVRFRSVFVECKSDSTGV